MALHVLHNALMISLIYFGPSLQAWGWDVEGQEYLPNPLLVVATVAAAAAISTLVALQSAVPIAASQQPAGTPPT
jgi:hypothetical protein